ncbi:MAG: glycosyl hydrolase [Sedimentisphaerales bacterium]
MKTNMHRNIFKEPPKRFRPVPFWFWNETREEKFNAELIKKQIDDFHEKGLGGFIIFNKPTNEVTEQFGYVAEEYLSDKWFNACRIAVEKGSSLGMEVWINDGFDFPPGDLGGKMENILPEAYQRELIFSKTDKLPIGTKNILSVVANPKNNSNFENTVDITDGKTLLDNSVEYDFWVTKVEKPARPRGHLHRFPDFLDPQVSAVFIRETYEKYKFNLGDLFGGKLTGFFADCDARRAGYYPWAREFDSRFAATFGYSIKEHLPALWMDFGRISKKVRYDYYSFISQLYSDWFKNCYEWCKDNNLKYMYHTSDTGPFSVNPDSNAYCNRSSYFIEGAFSEVNCHCDYIGTDHELMALNGGLHFDPVYKGKKTNWNPESIIWGISGGRNNHERLLSENKTYGDIRAKLASSNAHCKGKAGAMCEAYAATNWSATLEDLKWITDWQASQGITKFVPHAFFYSIEGYRKQFAPPNHYKQNHLWNNYKYFTDYTARVCSILSAGSHVADIAVIEPLESLWKNKNYDPITFFDLLDILNHSPWDYDVISEDDLRNAVIYKKSLSLLDENYKIVILAGLTDISEITIEKLKKIALNGGCVIELGCNFDIAGAVKIKHESFDNRFIVAKNPVIDAIKKVVLPDVIFFDKNHKTINSIHFTHRTTPQHDVYFVANLEGEKICSITANIAKTEFEPMIWNPTTGEIFKAKAKNSDTRTEVSIDLPFKSSIFIVVPKTAENTSENEISPSALIETQDSFDAFPLCDWQVTSLQDNILPISVWKDAGAHKICPAGQSNNSKDLYFEFNAEPCNCQLLIPDFLEQENIYINNNKLDVPVSVSKIIFDAKYLAYDVSVFINNGRNQIMLSADKFSNLEKMEYRPAYLCGDFKIDITAAQLNFTEYRRWYQFRSCIADDTKIMIYRDNKKLGLGDWSKQGYPFYSGKVRYTTCFNLKQHQNIILSIGKLCGCATVAVNGCHADAINWPPYELNITDKMKSGDNTLTITVENTDANLLEEYPEKSGIENIKLLFMRPTILE